VAVTRREFLLAGAGASLLVASGCVRSGAPRVETLAPGVVGSPDLKLDPELRFGAPPGLINPEVVTSFERTTGVHAEELVPPPEVDIVLEMQASVIGQMDAILVGAPTLAELVRTKQVEPLDGKLVPNRSALTAPFDNPPADPHNGHGVPFDYTFVGVAITGGVPVHPKDSWRGFFKLATSFPGRVGVIDNGNIMIGAALLATGHKWTSTSDSDLADATALLERVQPLVVLLPADAPARLGTRIAQVGYSDRYTTRRPGMRFYVPVEGSQIFVRTFCIPILAPDPVSAHAWLNHVIDPLTAAAQVQYSLRPTPVLAARSLLPRSIVQNPAICPPVEVLPNLVQSNLSPSDLAHRQQLWESVRP
jgi:spermidine/putrescine transport system substrate-binding protein